MPQSAQAEEESRTSTPIAAKDRTMPVNASGLRAFQFRERLAPRNLRGSAGGRGAVVNAERSPRDSVAAL